MTKFYVIRSGPFRQCGQYFAGTIQGDEVWSSSQARAMRFRKRDLDMVELIICGMSDECRRVRVTPSGSPAR